MEKLKTIKMMTLNLPGLGSEAISEFLLFGVNPFTQNEINAHKRTTAFAQVASNGYRILKQKQSGNK
jgi:hypothetical protein